MKITVGIRIEEETNIKLDKLAYFSGRTKSRLIEDALKLLFKDVPVDGKDMSFGDYFDKKDKDNEKI